MGLSDRLVPKFSLPIQRLHLSTIVACSDNQRFPMEIMHENSMCENQINMIRVDKLKNQRPEDEKRKIFIPEFVYFSLWGTKPDIQNRSSNFRWPASARAPGRSNF